jgi:precorrin-2 C(20)-methyltransferase
LSEICYENGEKMNGILYGIGVGAGDPELMTVKAQRIITACDLLILPAGSKEECHAYQIVLQAMPEISDKSVRCMPFPMICDTSELEKAHQNIYNEIVSELDSGKSVGFLTLGDPSVYSTYMYMHHHAEAEGRRAQMISGIPSFCAAAARLGISLGEKGEEIHIIPAAYDVSDTLEYHGTRVYMNSGKKLQELLNMLEQQTATGQQTADIYAVSNCGMETEQIYYGIEEARKATGYLTIVIVKSE